MTHDFIAQEKDSSHISSKLEFTTTYYLWSKVGNASVLLSKLEWKKKTTILPSQTYTANFIVPQPYIRHKNIHT